MEQSQNLPPSLIVFVFFSLVLSIWAIVDIVRSNFARLYKVVWILVVLFAPFGVFIYIFIGRRLKPLSEADRPNSTPEVHDPPDQPAEALKKEGRRGWPAPIVLLAVAVFCVLLYLRSVSMLGQETTTNLLLGAIVIVGGILFFLHVSQGKKRR